MASSTQTSMGFLAHILTLAMLYCAGWAQFDPCPTNATSCCQCITTPGCSWYYGPLDDTAERMPRCRPLALVAERPESYSQHYLAPPGLINIMDIPQRFNRPINPGRNRLLKPQTVRLTVGLGMRRVVPIQVKAQTRRVRLRVTGPIDAPEFQLLKGDGYSCSNRFRVRVRGGNSQARARRTRGASSNSRVSNSRRRSSMKALNIDCYVAAPGEIQNLKLVVDMNSCFARKKIIRIRVVQRGIKRTKVEIKSACSCPCQSASGEVVPGQEGLCPADQSEQQCVSVDEHGSQHSVCSGVNAYCQRAENEPVCSGQGICICAVCICNIIPRQNNQVSLSNGRDSIQQRYQGWYCQCDDTDCPWSHGAICGGPTRGSCTCGVCQCSASHRGEACEVTTARENCMDASGMVCSNHGQCVNGACVCEEGFTGALCEVCSACPMSCSIYQQCIECLVFPQHRTTANCDEQCAVAHPRTTFSVINDEWPASSQVCIFQAHNCFHEYAYSSSMNSTVSVYYRSTSNCHNENEFP